MMKIHNGGGNLLPHMQKASAAKAPADSTSKSASVGANPVANGVETNSTRDLQKLISEPSDERATRVQDIKARVESGGYFTPEAAQQAADAILSDI